jgi:F-type H+-transporting ATPase subunit epsilon
MEKESFTLDVVTLKQVVFSEPITSVSAPGTEGYFGILAGHTPFVSSLQIGTVKITKGNGEVLLLATSGGFLMTDGKKVILLADTAERAQEIDVARAEASRGRAEKRMAEKGPDIDFERAKASMMRAMNRLKVAVK